MKPGRILSYAAALLAAVEVSACATSRAPDPMTAAIEQPARDLSLIRDPLPAILVQAAENPYALAAGATCEALDGEIAALTDVLGADLDEASSRNRPDLAAAALASLARLPFRGVVREVTGAAKRDSERQRAIMAGIARRGFLKGVAKDLGCPRRN